MKKLTGIHETKLEITELNSGNIIDSILERLLNVFFLIIFHENQITLKVALIDLNNRFIITIKVVEQFSVIL